MFKKIYFATLAIFLFAFANAQVIHTKLDMFEYRKLAQGKAENINKPLIVQGNLQQIKALVQKYGGIYKYGAGRIASVQIPETRLLAFSNESAIERIENTHAHGVPLMDTARIRNNIDSAYFGYAPLSDSLTGKNVIVGVIDNGCYWRHKDFYNSDGTTRFKYIWDQSGTGGNSPAGYGYGTEYNWVQINGGNCQEMDPANDFGHGTIVTGIAAGNSNSLDSTPWQGTLRGAAPESQIIFVALDQTANANFLPNVSDAIDYIFQKASALCLPAVINTSVGTYYGSHDGADLTSLLIDSLITLRNDSFNCENLGRVVVAAAGNGGNIRYHLSYNLSSDSTNPGYTYYSYSPYVPGFYFDFWADTATFGNSFFTIGASDTLGNDYGILQQGYLNVLTNFGPFTQGVSVVRSGYYIGSGVNAYAAPDIAVTLEGGLYHVEIYDTVAGAATYLRFQTYGLGSLDGWTSSNPELGLYSSDMIDSLATGVGQPRVFITDPNYHHPDSLKTIVSSWQCSDDVITVGNYCNRSGYLDIDSVYVDLTLPANNSQIPGQIFLTSSLGPTRDLRTKPDVMATGSTTICTGDSLFIAQALGVPANHIKIYISGKDIRDGGTSMASPLVAGAAALYLQKRPTAPWNEVKQALICTAVADSFTGAVPNNSYGYGKINAFAALTRATCIVYGPMDTACINYNPLATVDTGACVLKVYGCTDSTATNYDSLANVNNGTCIYSGIKNVKPGTVSLTVTPNPFTNQTIFSLNNNGVSFKIGEIELTNQLGQIIDEIPVGPNSNNYVYHNDKLAAGIYLFRLKLDGKIADSGKVVVE